MISLADSISRAARFVAQWPGGAALIGGLAVVARVRARPTRDADFIIVATDPHALLRHAVECGYGYPEDVDDWLEGGLLPLWEGEDRAQGFAVDLILADDEFLRGVVARATPIELGDVVLPTATLEDLVLLKLQAGRPIDVDDVLAIKDAFADELDTDFLRREAASLGIALELELYFEAR